MSYKNDQSRQRAGKPIENRHHEPAFTNGYRGVFWQFLAFSSCSPRIFHAIRRIANFDLISKLGQSTIKAPSKHIDFSILKITPKAQNYAVVGGEVAGRTPRNAPAAHPLGPGALTVTDSALNVADLDLAPMARAH